MNDLATKARGFKNLVTDLATQAEQHRSSRARAEGTEGPAGGGLGVHLSAGARKLNDLATQARGFKRAQKKAQRPGYAGKGARNVGNTLGNPPRNLMNDLATKARGFKNLVTDLATQAEQHRSSRARAEGTEGPAGGGLGVHLSAEQQAEQHRFLASCFCSTASAPAPPAHQWPSWHVAEYSQNQEAWKGERPEALSPRCHPGATILGQAA